MIDYFRVWIWIWIFENEQRGPADLEGVLRAQRAPPGDPPLAAGIRPSAAAAAAGCGEAEQADSGGVRVAATRDVAGVDAVWVGDVCDRVHADAVGAGVADGTLFRRDRVELVGIREGDARP